jgi:hypothetical protein
MRRVLHSRGVGFLSHRLADSHHHADERASAAAEHLSGAVVEGFRVSSRGDARGGADGGIAGIAGRVAAGDAAGGRGDGGLLDRAADGTLPDLVCAEHAGACGYFCGGLHALGAGVRAAGSQDRKPWACGAVVCGGRAFKETAIAIPLTLAAVPGGGIFGAQAR